MGSVSDQIHMDMAGKAPPAPARASFLQKIKIKINRAPLLVLSEIDDLALKCTNWKEKESVGIAGKQIEEWRRRYKEAMILLHHHLLLLLLLLLLPPYSQCFSVLLGKEKG